jgi:uncharacterized sulfatase
MKRPITLLCLLLALLTGAARAATERPNIILIISDDHTWTHYGFMGHPIVHTPNLDRLAGESLLYTRGYATPVCSPSLACLLTGRRPAAHGITGNDLRPATPKQTQNTGPNRDPLRERLLANPLVLPKALSDAGYLTFQTGKLWNSSYRDMGFTHGMTEKRGRHGGEGLVIGRKGMEPIHRFIDLALEQEKPFFIWYAPLLPHDPHTPPARLAEKYRGKGPTPHAEVYHAMVEWFDETCGDLDSCLKDRNIKDNTVILYLADNGWNPLQGYKGGRAKLTPYENGIRTPMFIRWPGQITPLRDDETLASIIDFAPTILNLAGIKAPEKLPGLDLRDRAAMTARRTLFIESYTHDIEDLADPVKSLTSRTVIDGWSKLIVPGPRAVTGERQAPFSKLAGKTELFDLKNDPGEATNLATERPEEAARLKAMIDAWWKID